jgi:hypothetical protein
VLSFLPPSRAGTGFMRKLSPLYCRAGYRPGGVRHLLSALPDQRVRQLTPRITSTTIQKMRIKAAPIATPASDRSGTVPPSWRATGFGLKSTLWRQSTGRRWWTSSRPSAARMTRCTWRPCTATYRPRNVLVGTGDPSRAEFPAQLIEQRRHGLAHRGLVERLVRAPNRPWCCQPEGPSRTAPLPGTSPRNPGPHPQEGSRSDRYLHHRADDAAQQNLPCAWRACNRRSALLAGTQRSRHVVDVLGTALTIFNSLRGRAPIRAAADTRGSGHRGSCPILPGRATVTESLAAGFLRGIS